jgi:hypothetical protein
VRAYRHIDDRDEPITRINPARHSKTRQLRPLTDATIDAILAYVDRNDLGSLNRAADELERRP